MENLFDRILGSAYIMDSKFKDILKEYILDKITRGNLSEYASNLSEDEQIEVLKRYLDKLKNPHNAINPFQTEPCVLLRDSDISNTLVNKSGINISSKLNGGITYGDSKCSDSINMNICTKK